MRGFLTSDAVAALLAHFPEDRFKSTSTELQAAFRHVAKEFPSLLGNTSFGKVGAYIASSAIDAALDSLAASGFYSRYSRDLLTYELNREKLLLYYDSFLDQRFRNAEVSVDTIKQASLVLKDIIHEIHGSPSLDRLLVT